MKIMKFVGFVLTGLIATNVYCMSNIKGDVPQDERLAAQVDAYLQSQLPELQDMMALMSELGGVQITLDKKGMDQFSATFPNLVAAIESEYVKHYGEPIIPLFEDDGSTLKHIAAPESKVPPPLEETDGCRVLVKAGSWIIWNQDVEVAQLTKDLRFKHPDWTTDQMNWEIQRFRDRQFANAKALGWSWLGLGKFSSTFGSAVQACRDLKKIETMKPPPTCPDGLYTQPGKVCNKVCVDGSVVPVTQACAKPGGNGQEHPPQHRAAPPPIDGGGGGAPLPNGKSGDGGTTVTTGEGQCWTTVEKVHGQQITCCRNDQGQTTCNN